ncbi:MAG TPA: hypothetical protein VEK73_03220 [Xanthobacteraceae bacterium]|nr:hypothetical protein [Xanthobacteraceae bacterium]
MLRATPPGEDPIGDARATAVGFFAQGSPPGEDGVNNLYQHALDAATPPGSAPERVSHGAPDYLHLITIAEQQANLYVQQVNRRSWTRSYRAFHNEHFTGSKYGHKDWANRSKIFRPKTRSAVRKDGAAVAASLFGTVDAIACSPGDEADPRQRAAASLMQELINYRTDRTSGRAAIPWFLTAMGARQDAQITGICASKQYWKLELRKSHEEDATDEAGNPLLTMNEAGTYATTKRPVYVPDVDRPDIRLFPPECVIMDPAADWTNPAQSAAYLLLKYPMRLYEVEKKTQDPLNPWKALPPDLLKGTAEASKFDAAAIRRAREFGLDRFDETQNSAEFDIIWVYEAFIRIDGEDKCFFSLGDKAFLTDPKPTREVYPEQAGDRPVIIGYGALEAHRIYPMSAVESWQQTQQEINDVANLYLDTMKQNVAPVTKVVRGRSVDLEALHRRGPNSHILVTRLDDIDFARPVDIPQSVIVGMEKLDVDMDDLAGQFNAGSVQTNRTLNDTVGGLKLIAGASNAVQEFDIRLWIETWAEPALAQVVRLEQYYESDEIILGICGQRAQLWQKHGINRITDDLIDQQVVIRIDAGLGVGDPQQRLAKFRDATMVAAPLLAQSQEFQSGQVKLNIEEVMNEVFGAVGYRDGGKRFITVAPPNPQAAQQQQAMQGLTLQNMLAEIAKKRAQAQHAQAQAGHAQAMGLAAIAGARTDARRQAADERNSAFDHAHEVHDRMLAANEQGFRHATELANAVSDDRPQRTEEAQRSPFFPSPRIFRSVADYARDGSMAWGGVRGGGGSDSAAYSNHPHPDGSQALAVDPPHKGEGREPASESDFLQLLAALAAPRERHVAFVRDPATGRIAGARVVEGG